MRYYLRMNLQLIIGLMLTFILLAACDSNELPDAEPTQLPVTGIDDAGQAAYPTGDSGYPAPGTEQLDFPAVSDGAAFFIPPAEGIPAFAGKLAFHTERYGGVLQVAVMDGATGEITQVTRVATQAFEPDWSPDCSTIAYTQGVGDSQDFDIYLHDLGSGQTRPLIVGSGAYDWAPAWSPTGDVIAYQNNQDVHMNVCFTTPDGQSMGCMEPGNYSNAMPAWSPDASQLVFGSNRVGNWELYVTDYPTMSTLTRLTDNNDIDFHPQFSPDGEWIVFTSKRLGSYDLYLVRPDGRDERQLTFLSVDERDPTWVGNDQIAFTANIEEDWELYIINVDGSGLQRLTYSEGVDQWPIWCNAD
jgi:Tol biopolymer transport system component